MLRDQIKKTGAKHTPVIYLTPKYTPELTKQMGMLTADDFIKKPPNTPELILRIQKIMIWQCYKPKKRK